MVRATALLKECLNSGGGSLNLDRVGKSGCWGLGRHYGLCRIWVGSEE
jgi:hypothetical protein